MKTSLERAATRVEQEYKRHPEAVQLARLASLAVRVEPHLLRRLRLELWPDADVGIEADLWFGPLVESRGVRAIVLNRYVVDLLRENLAEDRQLFLRVIAVTEQAHAEAATTIRLEERLTALAVLNEPDSAEKIDEALRPALRTMQVGGEDARQLAQWAMRALPQAHPRVRESRNAIALGLSATLALGGRPIVRDVPQVPGDLGDMTWLLQGATSLPPTRIGVELVADGVAFAAPGGKQPQLELPETNPLVLSLAWKTDGGDAQMLVEAVPGRTVEIDAGVTEVELRTLSGDEYLLSAVSTFESAAESPSEDVGPKHFENDVYISSSRTDNEWVTKFLETLRMLLSQRTGREVRIWLGQGILGADYTSDENFVQLSKTAVMISVLSPRYLSSERCRMEVNEFCRVAEQTGGVVVDGRSRVFKIIKTPLEVELTQQLPPGIRDTPGYEFFESGDRIPKDFDRKSDLDAKIAAAVKMGRNDIAEAYRGQLQQLEQESNENFVGKVKLVAHDIAQMLSRLSAEPLPQPQSSGIFVSYRRDDSQGHAGRLYDKLAEHFGKSRIFMDVDAIEAGDDFPKAIENAVGSCGVLIAIIGRKWLSERLSNPNDYVRLEIAHALRRDIPVIPVLVQGASMTNLIDLPYDLTTLADRNAIELSDLSWSRDVDRLINGMERILADQPRPRPETQPQSEKGSRPKSIYLICDKQDYDATAPLEEHLFRLGFEVTLPLMEGDEAEVREDHKESLLLCDAVVIFYGNASEGWLRTKLRDLQKISGYGRTKPMLAQAVYIGPPRTPSKDRFSMREVPFIIRNFGEFAPSDLSEFVTAVQASEAEADVRGARDQQPEPPAKQSSGIFVSYRRDDSAAHASRLIDKLVDHFGNRRVFMDTDILQPGGNIAGMIENALKPCNVLIAIIGPNWLRSPSGDRRRLDDPIDFVGREIAYALRRDIPVIPVLVQGARMPNSEELPDDLAELANRQAIELTDYGWQRDVDRLISNMEQILPGQDPVRRSSGVVAKKFVIRGDVQGVGYRFFAQRAAAQFQVLGYVRNLPDGTVEVLAEGSATNVEAFKKELTTGPRFSKVQQVEEINLESRGLYASFRIEG